MLRESPYPEDGAIDTWGNYNIIRRRGNDVIGTSVFMCEFLSFHCIPLITNKWFNTELSHISYNLRYCHVILTCDEAILFIKLYSSKWCTFGSEHPSVAFDQMQCGRFGSDPPSVAVLTKCNVAVLVVILPLWPFWPNAVWPFSGLPTSTEFPYSVRILHAKYGSTNLA